MYSSDQLAYPRFGQFSEKKKSDQIAYPRFGRFSGSENPVIFSMDLGKVIFQRFGKLEFQIFQEVEYIFPAYTFGPHCQLPESEVKIIR